MNDDNLPSPATEIRERLINSFMKTTSSSREEAKSFLETHQWNFYAAVSAFTKNNVSDAAAKTNFLRPTDTQLISAVAALSRSKRAADTPCESERIKRRELAGNKPTLGGSNDYDGGEQSETVQEPEEGDGVERPVQSSSRIVSAEPQAVITYIITMWRNGYTVDGGPLHTRIARFIQTLQGLESPCDLNTEDNQIRHRVNIIRRQDKDFNPDDVDDKDKESDVERPVRSSPRIVSAKSQAGIKFIITMWRNGFTVDNGPLHTLDSPQNAIFIEFIKGLESPRVLNPQDNQVRLRVKLITRQDEDFNQESPNPNTLTLESKSAATEPPASSESLTTTPQPSMSVVVDPPALTTWIQLYLADGTCVPHQFNIHHTVRDIRDFVDALKPGGSKDYQLHVGFSTKPLLDFDQTIERAGICNSIVSQRFRIAHV